VRRASLFELLIDDRVVATNAAGTARGADRSLRTTRHLSGLRRR